jgi:hypothetical protein
MNAMRLLSAVIAIRLGSAAVCNAKHNHPARDIISDLVPENRQSIPNGNNHMNCPACNIFVMEIL